MIKVELSKSILSFEKYYLKLFHVEFSVSTKFCLNNFFATLINHIRKKLLNFINFCAYMSEKNNAESLNKLELCKFDILPDANKKHFVLRVYFYWEVGEGKRDHALKFHCQYKL